MGILITSAVTPLACTLLWPKQNWYAVISAPILGLGGALCAWLVCTSVLYGEISIATTGQNYPMLAGNVVALLLPMPIVYFISMLKPENYDFSETKTAIKLVESDEGDMTTRKMEAEEAAVEEAELIKSSNFAKLSSVVLTIALIVVWPLPLFFSNWVFDKTFFRGWVVFSIMWVWCSTLAVVVYPIFENGDTILTVLNAMLFGQRKELKSLVATRDNSAHNTNDNLIAA